MSAALHSKLDIARAQLGSAVMLFATEIDRVSAITLAGAASTWTRTMTITSKWMFS